MAASKDFGIVNKLDFRLCVLIHIYLGGNLGQHYMSPCHIFAMNRYECVGIFVPLHAK